VSEEVVVMSRGKSSGFIFDRWLAQGGVHSVADYIPRSAEKRLGLQTLDVLEHIPRLVYRKSIFFRS
jgi:hypothetical protein